MHEKFIWNTDDFIYVEVTNSFIPNKFRNRIFNLRKGSSKVFKTSTHSWYFDRNVDNNLDIDGSDSNNIIDIDNNVDVKEVDVNNDVDDEY
ncbi:6966_t:CDS:2 [Entrophospora sp. SA101]|nr:6966_t:CDS:2 [Entrophospora sp. SA101]